MRPKLKLLPLLTALVGCFVLVGAAFGIPPQSGPVLQASPTPSEPPPGFERLGRLLDEARLTEAAGDLERLAGSGPALPEIGPAEEEILIRAIDTARQRLEGAALVQTAEESAAARRLLCLARAYFPEELPLREGEAPEPMTVGEGVSRPEFVGGPKAQYTPEGRQERVAGTVILQAAIDREGCVRETRVLKGLPFGLAEAAAAAVRSWAFHPALHQNRPVNVAYVLTVNFPGVDDEPNSGAPE